MFHFLEKNKTWNSCELIAKQMIHIIIKRFSEK